MKGKPEYKHDCSKCTFLGKFEEYDLYYCDKSLPTLIARYGDEGPQYSSCPVSMDSGLKPLRAAKAMAADQDLLECSCKPGQVYNNLCPVHGKTRDALNLAVKVEPEKIFTDEFLDEIDFCRTRQTKDGCGRAVSKRPNGMTVLEWNNEGHSCTYFGEELESNVSLGVGKDGGTRTAFNGYVFNQEDVKNILRLTN